MAVLISNVCCGPYIFSIFKNHFFLLYKFKNWTSFKRPISNASTFCNATSFMLASVAEYCFNSEETREISGILKYANRLDTGGHF